MATLPVHTIHHADEARVDYTPGSAYTAGTPVQLTDDLVGIGNADIEAGRLGALSTRGHKKGNKADGLTIAVGDRIGWDANGDPQNGTAGAGAYTNVAADMDFVCGLAVYAAAAGDDQVIFDLNAHVLDDLEIAIADPGDGEAIPVTKSGHVPLVTGGAETRTLAAPSFPGQQCALYLKADSGDCVITCATEVNQTGNNTLTFADAGDLITLLAIEVGAYLRWRAMANDGVALSTV